MKREGKEEKKTNSRVLKVGLLLISRSAPSPVQSAMQEWIHIHPEELQIH